MLSTENITLSMRLTKRPINLIVIIMKLYKAEQNTIHTVEDTRQMHGMMALLSYRQTDRYLDR
jgi:hypothetical protein